MLPNDGGVTKYLWKPWHCLQTLRSFGGGDGVDDGGGDDGGRCRAPAHRRTLQYSKVRMM